MRSQKVILLLGGNQGDVNAHLGGSIAFIDRHVGKVIVQSRIYATKAWGPVAQPDFLNIAIEMYTRLPPVFLLRQLLALEQRYGRRRDIKFGPRTLDIDILFYGDNIISNKELQVPHPEIQNRRFALVPASEIAPAFVHPVLKRNLKQLLADCKDTLDVTLWKR